MAGEKQFSSETILLIDKKMNMTLDDLIKEYKKKSSNTKIWTNGRHTSYKSPKSFHDAAAANATAPRGNSSNLRQFLDERSAFRRCKLAERRTTFQENSLTTQAARKAGTESLAQRKSVFDPQHKQQNRPQHAAEHKKIVPRQSTKEHGIPVQHNRERHRVPVWRRSRYQFSGLVEKKIEDKNVNMLWQRN